MEDFIIRIADEEEGPVLTDLAMRSKASWGYSDDFMEACREELTFTSERMEACTVWVAVFDDTIVGMIALDGKEDGATAEVEQFFVDPEFQALGIGKALMAVLLNAAHGRGVMRLVVDSDPNAEEIYAKFGFVTTGRSPSGAIANRTLPRMEMSLA
jgi:GNAT superfamily N-acetyltransferase